MPFPPNCFIEEGDWARAEPASASRSKGRRRSVLMRSPPFLCRLGYKARCKHTPVPDYSPAGTPDAMQLLAGTSGFSYKEWLGKFYPEKHPADEMLARWAAEVPEGFSFTLKAPRRITHELRLKECETHVAEFLRRAQALGGKLGPILFQLPPFLKKDLPRLRDFLALLPAGRPAAFEFRNATWQDGEVYEALRARGAMLCYTDTEEGDSPPIVATAASGYLRLRRTHYEDKELGDWAERIAALGFERAYVYFMHEDDAMGTVFARKLMELWKQRNPK